MSAGGEFERLTEAVDRLIIRLHSLKAERDELAERLDGLAGASGPPGGAGAVRDEGYNLLRLHSARLLREREEMRRRLAVVLAKLESMQQ